MSSSLPCLQLRDRLKQFGDLFRHAPKAGGVTTLLVTSLNTGDVISTTLFVVFAFSAWRHFRRTTANRLTWEPSIQTTWLICYRSHTLLGDSRKFEHKSVDRIACLHWQRCGDVNQHPQYPSLMLLLLMLISSLFLLLLLLVVSSSLSLLLLLLLYICFLFYFC